MALVVSILIFLAKLLPYTWYEVSYVNQQIQANQPLIQNVQNTPSLIQQVKIYNIDTESRPGLLITYDKDEELE